MKYARFDLDQIIGDIGGAAKGDVDSIKGRCPQCGNWVKQDANTCDLCGIPVVWENSIVWRRLYGSPTQKIREYEMVLPTTRTGKELISACNTMGFRTQHDDDDWAKAESFFGATHMRGIIEYVTRKKHHKGAGGLAHALAIARKNWAERPKDKPPQAKVNSRPDMW